MTALSQPMEEEANTHLVTRLLQDVRDGNEAAHKELVSHVYAQLRKIAQRRMEKERSDHTLQPTELVHEAYMKMVGGMENPPWQNRAHFYGAAAEAMRRILINYARSRNAVKRGGGQRAEPINVLDLVEEQDPDQILALDDAIQQLEASNAQLGELVRLRFFAGLNVDETAEAMNTSRRTVIRHWNFARSFLARALQRANENG